MSSISIKVEFGGGLELLFANQKSYGLSIPSRVPKDKSAKEPEVPLDESSSKPADVEFLIHHLRDALLKERPELFMEGNTVRPGILVLINDTDWELEGEGDYELKDGDEIVFISTLHEALRIKIAGPVDCEKVIGTGLFSAPVMSETTSARNDWSAQDPSETWSAKFVRKFNENPWVPLGCLATCGALVMSAVKMRQGKSKQMNHWLRARVGLQGVTLVALVGGSLALQKSRKDELETNGGALTESQEAQRAQEKLEFEQRLLEAQMTVQMENEAGVSGLKTVKGPAINNRRREEERRKTEETTAAVVAASVDEKQDGPTTEAVKKSRAWWSSSSKS